MKPFPGEIQRKGIGGKIHLTAEQEDWFRQHFPVNTDVEVAAAMGMSKISVWRLSRRLGVAKDAAYMSDIFAAKHAAAMRATAGRPKTDEHKRHLSESKKAQRKRDQIRVAIGLQPLTRYAMPTLRYTQSQIRARSHALHRYNYLVDYPAPTSGPERYTIYYDAQTERNARFERWQAKHNHFTFLPT